MLLLGLITTLPMSALLPVSWGWENGFLENLQVVILLAGFLAALWAMIQQPAGATRSSWFAAALIWLLLVGRELAWGAAFVPPMGFDSHGPIISSRVLWYRPAVPWICLGLLLIGLVAMWRAKAFSRFLGRLQRDKAWPWGTIALLLLCLACSAISEGHGHLRFPVLESPALMVAEEAFETWAYVGLWLAQWHLIRHTAQWGRSLSSAYL